VATTEPDGGQRAGAWGQNYVSNPRAVRALAHPGRLLIMRMLNSAGPATASECARVAGMSPSAASYHLNQLARYGFVREAPGRGDRRERVWEALVRGFSITTAGASDDEALAVEAETARSFLETSRITSERWMQRYPHEPAEWREATNFGMKVLRADPDTMRELFRRMSALLEPYVADPAANDVPDGSRLVNVEIRMFPWDELPGGVEGAPGAGPGEDAG
jgi:DNA-binding MarR family transcriptional regulator